MSSIIDDLHQALADAISKHETAILTRWVVIAESVEEDGNRGVWVKADADASQWDVLGLVEYAAAVQRAQVYRDET